MTTHTMLRNWHIAMCCALLGCACSSLLAQATRPATAPATTQADDVAALGEQIRKFASGPQDPETLRAQRDLMAKLLALEAARFNGTVRLQGEVVDDAGQPLESVTASVTKTKATAPGPGGNMGADSMERRMVNGAFDWRFEDCASVQISFWKEGYYGVAAIGSAGKDQKGLRIVLQKRGQGTVLLRYSEQLKCTAAGEGNILDLAKRPSDQPKTLLKGIDDPAKVPAKAISLTAERAADGTIASIEVKTKMGAKLFPKAARLCINDEKGGILLYDKQGIGEARAFRQMRLAPEEGYTKDLAFTPEMCERWLNADALGMSFYFKTGGKYGKGFVRSLWLERNGDVTVIIDLEFQPDGSRNLEGNTEY